MSSIINIVCAKNIDICEWGPLRSIIYIYIYHEYDKSNSVESLLLYTRAFLYVGLHCVEV